MRNGSAGDFANTPNWGSKGSKKIPTSCCIGVTASNYTAPTTCTDNVATGTYYTSVCLNFILNFRLHSQHMHTCNTKTWTWYDESSLFQGENIINTEQNCGFLKIIVHLINFNIVAHAWKGVTIGEKKDNALIQTNHPPPTQIQNFSLRIFSIIHKMTNLLIYIV